MWPWKSAEFQVAIISGDETHFQIEFEAVGVLRFQDKKKIYHMDIWKLWKENALSERAWIWNTVNIRTSIKCC